jgi:hypothetical protein
VDPAANAVANAAAPQTWNMFAYVRNNPLSFIDPTGFCYQDDEGNYWDEDGAPCSVSTGGAINYGQTTTVTVNGDTDDVSTETVMWDFGGGGAGQTSVVFYAQGTARNQAQAVEPNPLNSGINAKHLACAADVAVNFGLGFIPGYNAAKLVGTAAGLNFNFFQNRMSGKSIVTLGASPVGDLAALGSAYSLASRQAFVNAGGTALELFHDFYEP